MTQMYLTGLIVVLAGGIIQLFFKEEKKGILVSLFSVVGSIMILISVFNIIFASNSVSFSYNNTIFSLFLFEIDKLSAFFIIVTAVMGAVAIFYSSGYMKMYNKKGYGQKSHYFFMSVLFVSMLLLPAVRNVFAFLVVWEIMSLSSFFLVVFEGDKKEVRKAGIYYLVMSHLSGVFIMVGMILAANISGGLDFAGFKGAVSFDAIKGSLVFIMLLIGFSIKAGFVPFHTWLPKAHPAAPSGISGMMSGIMIKMGIYGIIRTISFYEVLPAWPAYLILAMGIVSSLLGVLYAIAQHDIKRLLAFHSVENIGIIGIGIGIGMLGIVYSNTAMAYLGFTGALLHVLNHSIFKELLFFGAGSVYAATHTRSIDLLGGLIKKMPYTGYFFLVGAAAISGLPPFNGFISEFLIFLAMASGLESTQPVLAFSGAIGIAALAFTGAMALLCFTKVFSVVFLGTSRSKHGEIKKGENKTMVLSMGFLAFLCVLIGVLPLVFFSFVKLPATEILSGFMIAEFNAASVMVSLKFIMFFSIAIIVLSAATYFIRKKFFQKKTTASHTWGCGYGNANSRMQYTASSFATPFLKLSKPFVTEKEEIKELEGMFPEETNFQAHYTDASEEYLVKPVIKAIKKGFKLFSWIQGGDMRIYILYSLIFVTVAIFWISVIVK